MDNLDRTNVAQAAIAKYVLTKQLRDAGVFGENDTVDDHEELSAGFREGSFFYSHLSFRLNSLCSLVRARGCHLKGIQWNWRSQDRFHSDRKAHEEGRPR
jgi:hypothetical protein